MYKLKNYLIWLVDEDPHLSATREDSNQWELLEIQRACADQTNRQMQLLNRYDPLETQRMLDLAG